MFIYEKKLQFPVRIATPNPKLAAFIISQYGGAYINRLLNRQTKHIRQHKIPLDSIAVSLDAFKDELEEYSGRLVLRIPRSLHKSLKEAAALEGVSLNQYMLYKLSI